MTIKYQEVYRDSNLNTITTVISVPMNVYVSKVTAEFSSIKQGEQRGIVLSSMAFVFEWA